MEFFILALCLLVASCLAFSIGSFNFLKIPLPFLQIFLGIFLALKLTFVQTQLSSHVFFSFFLAPLLFFDALAFPSQAWRKQAGEIAYLAIGLVLFSVIVGSFLVPIFLPGLNLSNAVLLLAALAPTDPVALFNIAPRERLPSRLVHLLEGEALVNDVAGLLSMRIAALYLLLESAHLEQWALTGFFLITGGCIAGVITAWLSKWILGQLRGLPQPLPYMQLPWLILLPFLAHFIADALDASGILAAVIAGFAFNYAQGMTQVIQPVLLIARPTWNLLKTILNGLVFIFLGMHLPAIFRKSRFFFRQHEQLVGWKYLSYAVSLYLALFLLRFIWLFFAALLGRRYNRFKSTLSQLDIRMVLVASFAGMRGAVTLAAVCSLPIFVSEHEELFERAFMVCLGCIVVTLSLIVGSICLSYLLRRLPNDSETHF